jgi:hypothetical protein
MQMLASNANRINQARKSQEISTNANIDTGYMARSPKTSATKGGMKGPIIKKRRKQKQKDVRFMTEILYIGLFKPLTPELDLLLGERCNPQAPFDNPLSGLEAVFRASVNEAKKALDNAGCGAIPFEVDQ